VFVRRLLNAVLRVLFKILLKIEIIGLENVPPQGPVILMINHINFLDPVLTVGLMPRPVTAFAKIETLDYPILGFFIRIYGVVPVRRGEVDRRALRQAIETLVRGEAFLVAPEGTRSHHGRLQPARDGIAYIALRTGATILPVAIWGQERFVANLKRLRRTPIHVRIGKPFRFAPSTGSRDELRIMTREAMYQLAALLPPEYRGVYSDLEKASTDLLVSVDHNLSLKGGVPAAETGQRRPF
jgi:1-acyl-sn-glycerol-3-phosphate acyltransferase